MIFEIAKKWVAALRSGKYKQGQEQLRRGDAFCCLGVLCNLHAEAHPEIAAAQTETDSYMHAYGQLPKEVKEWAGMRTSGGTPSRRGAKVFKNHNLIEANDDGVDFIRLADYIEQNWSIL